jgi:putative transposase
VAERDLKIEVMKEVAAKMVSVPVRREQVAYATCRGLSQRRSCTLLSVSRSAPGYRSVKAAKDAPVLARMTALGAQYPRFGYRRIRVFLEREDHGMSWGGPGGCGDGPAFR